MAEKGYVFQRRKRSLTQKIFENGLNTAGYILIGLKEIGENFLEELPNCYPQFKMMKDLFGANNKKTSFNQSTIRSNLARLEKQGLIAKGSGEKIYCLTEQGEEFVSYIKNRHSILKEKWDGQLRLVVFDVPEKEKQWRSIIREELLLMQFQQLQKSVYVGKYPLSRSFYREIEKAGVSDYVFIFTINKTDREKEIIEILEGER